MKYIIRCHLKDLRKDKDLTQEELADKLGISRQALITLEQGRSLPSLNLAFEMANLFEKSIEEIFCDLEKQINEHQSKYRITMPRHPSLRSGQAGEGVKMDRDLMPFGRFGMRRFFDDDFDEDSMPVKFSQRAMQMPRVDVYEKDKNVVVEVQLPGIKVEDVNIEVADNYVSFSGKRKEEKEDKDKNFYRKEVNYGSFSRVVSLPVKVKSDKAEAESKDGVLKVTLPKAEEKKTKRIQIKIKK